MARQAGIHLAPDQEGDRGSARGAAVAASRSADRRGAGQEGPRRVARDRRHLHPSRLRAARPSGPVRRLVLPLPRLGLRHVRPHPFRPGAVQPRSSCLRVPGRHQVVGSGSDERTFDLPAARPPHEVVGGAAAARRPHPFLVRRVPDAAQPELLVDLRRHSHLHARGADRDRRRAGDALHADLEGSVRLGRAHHARRELRLAVPLRARQRRLDVLPRRLHPHVPRALLRLLQGAARGAVDSGRHHLPADDGDRVHGLRAALGPDELLGRDRHHQPVLGDPAVRQRDHPVAVGRLRGGSADAAAFLSRCTICCRS